MTILALGLALFVALHLIPIFGASWRERTMARTGKMPYRIAFGFLAIASLTLVVHGWQASSPYFVYDLGMGARHGMYGLVLVAFILMVAAFLPSRIGHLVPNPRMTAIGLWAAAHLLVNGEDRSLLLFGAILGWAIIAYWGAYRRDGGPMRREAVPGLRNDILAVLLGGLLFAAAALLHEAVIGVAVA